MKFKGICILVEHNLTHNAPESLRFQVIWSITFYDIQDRLYPVQELLFVILRAGGSIDAVLRQNAAGKGGRGRGERAVLLHLRLGVCGDVRGHGRVQSP